MAHLYKIGTLARQSGFSPQLLRVWEKRYDLFRPRRGPGGQRLYDEEDLKLLSAIKISMAAGSSIGELASQGREALLAAAPARSAVLPPIQEPQPSLEQFIVPLLDAARALDPSALIAALDRAFTCLSTEMVVDEVLVPAMRRIGDAWQAGEMGVAAEHLASSLVEYRLRALLEQSRYPAGRLHLGTVICGCFPEEEHRLGILMVAVRLLRQGWNVVYLGASLPLAELEKAIEELHPAGVWLSVTGPGIYQSRRAAFLELVRRYPRVDFVVGGSALAEEETELRAAGVRRGFD